MSDNVEAERAVIANYSKRIDQALEFGGQGPGDPTGRACSLPKLTASRSESDSDDRAADSANGRRSIQLPRPAKAQSKERQDAMRLAPLDRTRGGVTSRPGTVPTSCPRQGSPMDWGP